MLKVITKEKQIDEYRKDKEDIYAEVVDDMYKYQIISEKILIELQGGTMKKIKKKMILSYNSNHLYLLKLYLYLCIDNCLRDLS